MRTPEQEHEMARRSALYTVKQRGVVTLKDVMREQGLCEIRAARALADLVAAGTIVKIGNVYRMPDGKSGRGA